ncbi:MAG: right-handed parallel beta-helix repeat-containing protein [Daejeonella sp.]|nr:right-handed parallel beta-helix repeat-containing protein [Daejeonella sp.]
MKTKQSTKIQKLLLSTVIGITALVFTNCKKENQVVPESVVKTEAVNLDNEVMVAAITAIPSGSYDLRSALPAGYVTDGSVDYTTYVQTALNKNANITFPAFPILINDTGLFLRSNQTITFLTGGEIRLAPSAKEVYNIIRISEVSNVTLINPVVIGDRNKHVGLTGEGGVGIGIRGSSNITLVNPNVRECWGDGIYIGQARSIINSTNITIKNGYFKRNRRAGISIISVDGLLLDKAYAGYSDGVAPKCGLNFEPNNPSCTMKNITVNNLTTAKNTGQGVQIGLRQMVGSGDRFIDFNFTNLVDNGSNIAFKVVASPVIGTTGGHISGLVSVSKASWSASSSGFPLYYSTNQPNYKLALSTISVTDAGGISLSQSTILALIKRCVNGVGSYTFLP